MSVRTVQAQMPVLSEDVYSMVKALKEASHDLPRNTKNVEALVERLKVLNDKQEFKEDPKLRRKVLSLCNLITHIEPKLERARKLSNRRGLKYLLSRAKGKVMGNDITNVATTMESEIQSWLDQQNVEHLVKVLEGQGSNEEEQVDALCGFEARVKEGYNPELQDIILSLRVFDSLSALLRRPGSPRVKKEAAFALAALVHFNKDVFVSQILLSGVMESLLAMVDVDDDLAIGVVSVIGSLVTAGKGAVVDEIHARGGVKKIVGLLEDERDEMRVVAMDCVFEIAFYGRKEAVEAMLDEDLVRKLAKLQQSEAGGDLIDLPMYLTRKDSSPSTSSSASHQPSIPDSSGSTFGASSRKNSDEYSAKLREDETQNETFSSPSSCRKSTDCVESPKSGDEQHYSAVEDYWQKHPFVSAVARFAIQLEIGQGLRQREKRALKQEILKRVREAVPSDADVATILAEILWGP